MYTNGPKIVTDGLVLCLDAGNRKSYAGSGTSWLDLSGNGNTGTLTNGPSFNGDNGGSIVFDGVNDYVALPAAIDTNSTFALEFWARRSANATPTLLSGISGADTGYLQIRMGVSNVSLVKSYIAELGNFGSTSATALNTNNHVVVTRTGTTYTGFVNGLQRGTLTINQTYTTTTPTLGANSLASEFFTGRIYKFAYYNRILTATEVLQNYNATRSRFGV